MFSNVQISFDVIAALAFLLPVLWLFYKKAIRPFIKWTSSMIEAVSKINVIYEQMFTNGGTTLRDAINRVEEKVSIIDARQSVYMMDTKHGIYTTDPEGYCISVNRTYCRWLGRTESECLGNGWINNIPIKDREKVMDAWMYAVENEIEFALEYDMIDSNGNIFPVKSKANALRSGTGKVLGYLGLVEKIKVSG